METIAEIHSEILSAGILKLARHFSGEFATKSNTVPEGRLKINYDFSSVPTRRIITPDRTRR
jgi:hypothetical protein